MKPTAGERLTIDRDRLDDELIRQPQLFFEAGEACAMATSRREQAKDDIKRLSAELYLKLRRKLADSEQRVTEAALNAHVDQHEDLIAARARYADAVAAVELAQARKEAFSQRAWMLRELCGLFTAGYYAKNSVEGGPAESTLAERNKREMQRRRATMA